MACERVFTIKNGGVIMVSYIDKRHCRNEETIETRCDELARYNACGSRASHDIFFDWMTSEGGMI